MVTLTRAQRLTLPLAPAVAIAGGLLIALTLLFMPAAPLEQLVTASGIVAIVAAAEPPLGFTARIALALILGGGFAGFTCLGLNLLIGDRDLDLGQAGALLRRSDIHPDAPPRPPLFAARDLGTPFLDVKAPTETAAEREPDAEEIVFAPAEQSLPSDLDQPMAAYDPGALLAEPLPAPEPLVPLAPRPALIDPGDRFETFELTPVERSAALPLRASTPSDAVPRYAKPDPVVAPETEATVHDLLARLERGIAARPVVPKPMPVATAPATGSLAGTLGDLRRLATGSS